MVEREGLGRSKQERMDRGGDSADGVRNLDIASFGKPARVEELA